MNKKELLAMPKLKASSTIKRMAMADEPEITVHRDYWNQKVYETRKHKTVAYFRCCTKNGILKLSCYLTESLRTGFSTPRYDIYFSRDEDTYLTYDNVKQKWLTGSYVNLEWPSYHYYSNNIWYSRETRKAVQRYFDSSKNSIVDIICNFQNRIMDDRLKARHRKETDPWDKDLAQTPDLPKDWDRWVDKVGITENYIFYKYSKGTLQDGYCTFCEHEVKVKARHNKEGICPHCRKKVIFKALGRFKWFHTERQPMYLMRECKDGFMIREFRGYRAYSSNNYKTPSVSCYEVRRAIGGLDGKLLRAYYHGRYKNVEYRWIRNNVCAYDFCGDYSGMIYGKTLPSLFKKGLRVTGLKEYYSLRGTADPEKFLSAYTQQPYVEKFAKVGLIRLLDEITGTIYHIFGYRYVSESIDLDKSQTSIIKMLRLTPPAFRRLRKLNGNKKMLVWLQFESDTKKEIPDAELVWLMNMDLKPEDIKFTGGKMTVVQIVHYLQRQMKESGMKLSEVLTTWKDYLSLAARVGYDTNDEIVYRVRKLKQRHDELVALCQCKDDALRAGEILATYPRVEKNLAHIKNRYEFSDETYTVIVPTRIEEILAEGRALHHCVAEIDRYWDRIERNESYVFFLRKTDNLDKAYYTLEVEPGGTVRQKRTMYDRQEADIEDASSFLRKWQHEIHSRMTKEDRELAQTSRILRLENFNELREKNVLINTGKLQGQRLVDILMADLMEAA